MSENTTRTSMMRGLRCRCPRCGEGRLFRAYLKVVEACPDCGKDYSKADAADGPAVFIMFIVGFIVALGAFAVERTFMPPLWVHAALWGPLTLGLSLLLLQPFKGLLIALQFHHQAGEAPFGHEDET